MKTKSLLLSALALALLTGCSKPESRYELSPLGKGLVRLDKVGGDMVVLDETGNPTYVNLTLAKEVAKEQTEIDPQLLTVKKFEFQFPGGEKPLQVRFDYRWFAGNLQYRLTITPYSEAVNSAIYNPSNDLTLRLMDEQGFEITHFPAPLTALSLHGMVDSSGKLSGWQADGLPVPMAKLIFQRISFISYSWQFTDEMNAALKK
jgi:hypothetical protein